MATNYTAFRSGLQLPTRTTRGTPSQRAAKGYWPGVRYEVLATKPSDLIERMVQAKLRLMRRTKRRGIATTLTGLSGHDRREHILRLLAGLPVG